MFTYIVNAVVLFRLTKDLEPQPVSRDILGNVSLRKFVIVDDTANYDEPVRLSQLEANNCEFDYSRVRDYAEMWRRRIEIAFNTEGK